jgi:hypothetical protein
LKADGETCRLEGWPKVEFYDNGRRVDIPSKREDPRVSYGHPVRVDRGHPGQLVLTWSSLWCTKPVENDRIRVYLPDHGGSFDTEGFGQSPYCNGEPGSGPTPVVIEGFRPPEFTEEEVTSEYEHVDVQVDSPAVVPPKETFSFEVVLTARKRDVVLDPCPDYIVWTVATGSMKATYALNCAAVPYRDAEGRPMLPSGVPVRFAMRAAAPAAEGQVKFGWNIDAPGAGGASPPLTVAPGAAHPSGQPS